MCGVCIAMGTYSCWTLISLMLLIAKQFGPNNSAVLDPTNANYRHYKSFINMLDDILTGYAHGKVFFCV